MTCNLLLRAGSLTSFSPCSTAEIQLSLIELKVVVTSQTASISIHHCTDSVYLALEPPSQPERLWEIEMWGWDEQVLLQCCHSVSETQKRWRAFSQRTFLQSKSSYIHKLVLSFTPHKTSRLIDLFQKDLMGEQEQGVWRFADVVEMCTRQRCLATCLMRQWEQKIQYKSSNAGKSSYQTWHPLRYQNEAVTGQKAVKKTSILLFSA